MKLGTIDLSNGIDIEEFENLEYNKATVDPVYLEEYLQAGHFQSQMVIYNYFEPNPMPNIVSSIKEHFNFLSHLTVAINYMKPGTYLPLHCDLYKRWLQVHNITKDVTVQRYIVMLEDNVPGQILQIKNNTIGDWSQGDYFGWQGNDSHAIYNFSNKDRFAIQITGIK